MKEGRRERKEKIETKNLYLSKKKQTKMERRQRGTFLSRTRDVDTSPLFLFEGKQTDDSLTKRW